MAFLLGEEGSDVVEEALLARACCSAASWSEVAQVVRSHGRDWDMVRELLQSYQLQVEPLTVEDDEIAYPLRPDGPRMSLNERLSLALSSMHSAPVLTADPRWGSVPPAVQVR